MKKLLFIVFVVTAFINANANNIRITNVSVVPTSNTIKFDAAWDNGWRSGILNNWDAAWVFFKYKDLAGNWVHLNLTNIGNVIPTGFNAGIGSAGSGAMLFRSVSGSGTTAINNVELGIAASQALGIYDIRAFAVEMVFVPGGPFFWGDGDFWNNGRNASITNAAFTDVYFTTVSFSNRICRNGFNAYYCMKYELSQGGYRDFLNSLTYAQQINHIVAVPSAAAGTAALFNLNRNHIKIKTPGIASATPDRPAEFGCDADLDGIYDETTDGEYIACNFLNWPDQAAYLAWAGLMPLTEFEYEKAARGIALPVNGEYAWGNTQIVTNPLFILTNPNQLSETVSNSSGLIGNANYINTLPNAPFNGPVRNGVFATALSTKVTSGGSFYGIMELSGNLSERVVTLDGIVTFTTPNPNLNLNIFGYAVGNSAAYVWPGLNTGNFSVDGTQIVNVIYRGGAWSDFFLRLEISDRFAASSTLNTETNRTSMAGVGVRGCVIIP